MNEWLLFLGAGAVGGLLLGLVGVGTALVVVPLLAFVLPAFGVPASAVMHTALGTSMAVIAVTSVASVIAHHRRGNVNWGVFRVTGPASVAGVVAGVLVVATLPAEALRFVFAAFMLVSAVRMAIGGRRQEHDAAPARPPRSRLLAGGAVIGFLASLIGAGGGVFMVPYLSWLGLAVSNAVATSTAIGLPVTLVGAGVNVATGYAEAGIAGGSLGYVYLPAFVALSIGSAAAAPLGARLASRLPERALRLVFAVCVAAIAIRMLIP